ncbi:MAG: RluA family pseudouridine synthase [Acidimicrobiales bacterium]
MRHEIPPSLGGERIDRAAALLTGLSRSTVADLVARGAVRLGGRVVAARSARVTAGEELMVELPGAPDPGAPGPADLPSLPVVHADAHVIVVDKPSGMVTHPGAGHLEGTLSQAVVARFPDVAAVGPPERPGIVHRLDRGTSGLVVVARTEVAYRSLVTQLAARRVERRYLALVWGHPQPPTGMVDAPVGRSARDRSAMAVTAGGREARTRYHVQARYTRPTKLALVRCHLETGRTHQVRVHLAAIGHPVVGDRRYGGRRPTVATDRVFLHAERLAFDHPGSGARVAFDAPLPPALASVLAGLA